MINYKCRPVACCTYVTVYCFQIPLTKAVEVPRQHQMELGQLSFPQAPTFALPNCVIVNEDKWASLAIIDKWKEIPETRQQVLGILSGNTD